VTVVRDVLIEAVSYGVQPAGNQFNIIAGRCYITKEGYTYLLNQTKKEWDVVPKSPPRIQGESALVIMDMKYRDAGTEKWTSLDPFEVPVKVNKMMGVDAVIGKATRKASKRLYEKITGRVTPEGDVEDVDVTVVESTQKKPVSTASKLAEQASESMVQTKTTKPKEEKPKKESDSQTSFS
jgi:hypothetical protein